MSTDDIKEELRADGVEPDEALQRLMRVVTQASADSRKSALDRAREKRLKEQDRVKKTIGKFKDWTREQLLDKIRTLSGEHGLQAAASYRELGEQTEDNLRALLEDLEMLQRQKSKDSDDD
jgi:uncharacterized protein (DUF2461 family)